MYKSFQWHYLKMNLELFFYKLLPYKNVKKKENKNVEPSFDDLIKNIKSFRKIIVVCGGPSSLNIKESSNCLYFSTNSSYELVKNFPFIYYVTERRWLLKYLKLGFDEKQWLGSIFRLEKLNDLVKTTYDVKIIKKYKKKYYRSKPEIFCTNFLKDNIFSKNFEELETFFKEIVGIKFKSFNSGFSVVSIGFFLAYKLGIPIEIYGMDFGEGGKKHFDNSPMTSNSVVGERVKKKYKELYKKIVSQNKVEVINSSFFNPLEK